MKRKLVVALIIGALTMVGAAVSLADSQGKIDICHVPPGNPANAHIINISVNAVPAHLGHGDPPPGQGCGQGGGGV